METSIVYGLQRVLAGMPLYSDPEAAPFAIIQYSPLYYQLVGTIGKWLSVDPEQPFQVFRLSRWAGLVFNLMGLVVIANILKGVRLETKWKLIAILLAWLCLEPAHYARPDSLQSLFFLLFVWAALRYIHQESWGSLIWAVLAATLACWSKQNGILLPVFLLFYLFFIQKNIAQGFGAGGVFLILNALLGFILIEDASLFYANVIRGLDNGISFPYFFSAIYDAGVKKFFPFFLIGIYLALQGIFFPSGKQLRFLGWFLGASFSFAILTSLKWGSIPSYFTDFVHLSLISGAFWLADFKTEQGKKLSFSSSLFLGLVFLFIIPLHTSGKEWGRVIQEGQSDWFAQAKSVRAAIQKQGLQPGEYIFTHDYLINLFLFRHCLFPQNDIVYCCTAPRKTYDYTRFEELIGQGKVPFVIDWNGENPRKFLGNDFHEYKYLETSGRYGVWKIK
jgi:hypothetical protein